MGKIELVHIVPNLTDQTYEMVESLWSSYNSEYCHNYASLSQSMDSAPDKDKLKKMLEPFKKLGFVYTARGLMTEEGEVAGSGFCVNGQLANHLLELAMYRYNFNNNPLGKSDDYVPFELNVGEYKYKLVRKKS